MAYVLQLIETMFTEELNCFQRPLPKLGLQAHSCTFHLP